MIKIILFFMGLFIVVFVESGSSITLQNQTITVGANSIVLQVPENTRLEFVAPLNAPRFITKGPDDELIIGSRGPSLYRLKFPYTRAETLVTLSGFLHSAEYRQGILYAAETAAVWSAPYRGAGTNLRTADFSVFATLPSATRGHSSRTIIKGPDNRLYVSLGISGNCSDEYLDNSYPFERRRGGVYLLDNAGGLQPFSSGLRNPIGLAFHPVTGTLYATNAGPDNLGFFNPPEVFTALSFNSFHGMPWFQFIGGNFRSGECATSPPPRPASEAVRPSALFPARSTPEGFAFLSSSSLSRQLDGSVVVAIHGSHATQPGRGIESTRHPQLSLVVFEQQRPVRVEDFITGFQRFDGSRFARPVGVALGGDGHLYFTSDGGDVTGLFRLVPVSNSRPPIQPILELLLKKNP